MTAALVLDASITMSWAFEDEAGEYADRVLQRVAEHGAVVPAVWPLEVVNVLAVARRRGRTTEARCSRFLSFLDELPISVESACPRGRMDRLLSAAMGTGLSSYDACYFQLAISADLPLATADSSLRRAIEAAGGSVF